MKRKILNMALVATLGAAIPIAARAQSSPKKAKTSVTTINKVTAFEVREKKEGTFIRIKGSQVPTFSVFKLRDPLRIFVDLSNSRLGDSETRARRINNGVISQVSLLEFEDNVKTVTRLIIGFDQAAHYDVRTDGHDVVIVIDGDNRRRTSQLRADREKYRETAERLERVEKEAAELRARLEKARRDDVRRELEQKIRAKDRAVTRAKAERKRVASRVAKLERELREERARASERIDALAKKRDRVVERAEKLERALEHEKNQSSEKIRTLSSRHGEALERVRTLEKKLAAEREQSERKEASIRASLEKDRTEAIARARSLEKKLAAERRRSSKRSGDLERERRSALREARALASRLESEREQLRAEKAALQSEKAALKKENQKVVERARALERQRKAALARAEKAEAARRRALSEAERRQAEQKRARERIEKLESELGAARSSLAATSGEKSRLASKLDELDKQARAAADKLDRRQKALDQARRRHEKLEKRMVRLRASANKGNESARTELERLQRRTRKLDGRYEKARQQLAAERRAADAKKRQLETMKRLVAQRDEEIAELRSTIEKADRARKKQDAARLAAEKKRLAAVRESIARKNQRVEALEEARRAEESRLASLRRSLDDEKGQLSKIRARRGDEQAQLSKIRARRGDEQAQLSEIRARRGDEQARLEKIRARVREASKRLEAIEAQKRTLEEEAAREEQVKARAARAVPVDPDAPNAVRNIRLETVDGRSRIVVELERPGTFETRPARGSRAVMILNDVALPDKLERTLESGAEGGAVRFVSSFRNDDGEVHMEAELDGATSEMIRQDGNKLIWEFAPMVDRRGGDSRAVANRDSARRSGHAAAARQPVASPTPRRPRSGESFTSARPRGTRTIVDPTKVSGVPGMSRQRVSIDLREADIQNVLRLIAKQGGVNIIAGSDVSGTVTMRLRSVPLDEVFLTVLQAQGLGFEVRSNVIRVAPQETLAKEEQARALAAAEKRRQDPLEVFLIPVNYATADELVPQIRGLLSSRGSVQVDERTNTLIIKDIQQNLASIRALVENLDTQVPQVLIEARIVETTDTFNQQIGIQWGGDLSFSQANGNPTGLIFPSVVGVGGAAQDQQTQAAGTSANPNFAVNLPAPIGTGSGGGIGLTLGSLGGAFNLNLRLTALEDTGHAKIVSSPKILTLDNREASISQGTSIPISVVSAAGVQTVFVDATLELTVTPHVTPDGNIQLEIEATKNEPDFQNTGSRGDPTIIRKAAETELLIKDGDTTVIGGIYTSNSGTSLSAVPFFHKIPIIGVFFRNTSQSERRNELLIFITPKIVNRAEALGSRTAGMVNPLDAEEGTEAEAGGGQQGGAGAAGGAR